MTLLLSMEVMPAIEVDAGDGAMVTGVAALASICVAVIASARIRFLTNRFGLGGVYGTHRLLGVIALASVALHIIFVLLEDPSNYYRLLPWSGNPAGMAACASTYGLMALIALAMWSRRRDYDVWRRWHLALGVTVVLGGVLHVIFLKHLVKQDPFFEWLLVVTALAVGGLLYRWVTHPMTRNSYTVAGVRDESPTVSTVTLVPKRGRHRPNQRGAHFRPGQFGWLRLTKRAGTDHPYSFSSSAHNANKVQVTVRRGGGFTENLVSSTRGRPVWIDGPHGDFSPSSTASGLVLICAGVGITPMVSILRTCADRRDGRPIRLIQIGSTPDDLLFSDEVDRMDLNLQVTRMLTRSHPEWSGPVGRIDAVLLNKVLPGDPMRRQLHFYLCGPPQMVSDTTAALLLAGIPRNRIHSEQFLMPTPKDRSRAPKHTAQPPVTGGRSPVRPVTQRRDRISSTIPLPVVRDDGRRPQEPAGPQPQLHPHRPAQPAVRPRPRHPVRARSHRQAQRRMP